MRSDDDEVIVGAGVRHRLAKPATAEETVAPPGNEEEAIKKQRGRPKGKAKARGKSDDAGMPSGHGRNHRKRAGGQGDEQDDATRKCRGHCGRELPLTDFNADQKRCKSCWNERRRFSRLAAKQGQAQWFEELENNDPKAASAVLKKFSKFSKAEENLSQTFSLVEAKQRIIKRRGRKNSRKAKWMWENEFVEDMQTTRHGNYTATEAKRMWADMLKSGEWPTDDKGPRGTTRMKVPVGDYASSFSELDSEEELETRRQPAKKKVNAEEVKRMAVQMIRGRASSAFLSDDDDDGGDDAAGRRGSRLSAALQSMDVGVDIDQFKTPSKRKANEDSESNANDDDETARTDSKRPKGASSSKARHDGGDSDCESVTWFDKDTNLPKAARGLLQTIEKLKTELELQESNGEAALLEFKGMANASAFQTEMSVLKNRVTAASLVLGSGSAGDDTTAIQALSSYIQEFGAGASNASVSSSGLGGAGVPCRAGPCPGFKQLATIVWLRHEAEQLKMPTGDKWQQITSQDELTAAVDAYEQHFKSLNELVKAIRSASSELYQAKLDQAKLKSTTQQAQKAAALQMEKLVAGGAKQEKAIAKKSLAAEGGDLAGSAKFFE